jgi:hypothetical protein
MADKTLVLEVYRVPNGWCAEGTITLDNGNKYHSKVEVQAATRKDLYSAGEGDGEGDEPKREEAVKELLDQLIALLENPILQPVLPLSVKVTVKAIKGTRRLLEAKRAGGHGSMSAGFNLYKLGLAAKDGNDIIVGALRGQRLFGEC